MSETTEIIAAPIDWKPGGAGAGILNLGRPKVQGTGHRSWDATIVSDVAQVEAAGQLHMFHGDVGAHWLEALDEINRHKASIIPLKEQNHVVRISTGDGVALERARVELLEVKIDFNTNRRVQISRIRIHGVAVADAAIVVGMQEQLVGVTVLQQGLKVVQDAAAPEVGQIISGLTTTGMLEVGRMTGIDPDTDFVEVDDFGATYLLRSVASAFTLESMDATPVVDHLAAYEAGVAKTPMGPSWSGLVEAMASAAAAGEVQRMSGSTAYLNAAVIDRAVAAAKAAKASASGA